AHAPKRLETLRTPEGTAVPANTLAELQRDMAHLRFVKQQIKEICSCKRCSRASCGIARRWRGMPALQGHRTRAVRNGASEGLLKQASACAPCNDRARVGSSAASEGQRVGRMVSKTNCRRPRRHAKDHDRSTGPQAPHCALAASHHRRGTSRFAPSSGCLTDCLRASGTEFLRSPSC